MADPFAPVTGEPDSITRGSYSAWVISDRFDPVVFDVSYRLGRRVIAGEHTDGRWAFSVGRAVTGEMEPGEIVAELVVTRRSDNETTVVRSSCIRVFGGSEDRRSHAALMVRKIESILERRADSDVESYTVKSRSISKMSISELTEWRSFYLAEMGREIDARTGRRKQANTVKVGFI